MTSAAPSPRSDLALALAQLDAIERWHAASRSTLSAARSAAVSREARMDLRRREDVLRVQHRAIVERTEAQLAGSIDVLHRSAPRRAVVVHRSSWFVDRFCAELLAAGVQVSARLTNGAEAVGTAVAEQPDLLLVEDTLPMQGGEDVVREVRRFCADIRIAAQVEHDHRIAALLEAGADAAYTRRTPPPDLARGLVGLLDERDEQPA